MTFGDFFEAIVHSRLCGNISSCKIVMKLFDTAKSRKDVSSAAAYKWISGKRTCQTIRYFPNGTKDFNTEGVYKYFRSHVEPKLRELQRTFREYNDCIVQCNEKDLDVFCWSIVNQFLSLLNLTMVEIQGSIKAPDNCSTEEQMRKEFVQLIRDYGIVYFMHHEHTFSHKVDEFAEAVERKILFEFIGNQKEYIYKKINEFRHTIFMYNHMLEDVNDSTIIPFEIYTHSLEESDLPAEIILHNYFMDEIAQALDKVGYKGTLPKNDFTGTVQGSLLTELLEIRKKINIIFYEICNDFILIRN